MLKMMMMIFMMMMVMMIGKMSTTMMMMMKMMIMKIILSTVMTLAMIQIVQKSYYEFLQTGTAKIPKLVCFLTIFYTVLCSQYMV
jgi:hypothetical protein